MNFQLSNESTSQSLELDSRSRRRVKECPCGKSNRDGKFVPYVGFENAGFCHSCGETFLPKNQGDETPLPIIKPRPQREIQTISIDVVAQSQSAVGFEKNPFVLFLFDLATRGYFSYKDLFDTLEIYHIGTTKDLKTIFWLMDIDRSFAYTGQIIPYDKSSGKRIKTGVCDVQWVHTRMSIPNDATQKPLFGLQLLGMPENDGKPVGILESPKSAVIASLYYGDAMVFLATYGKYGCRLTGRENCRPLLDRSVVLYPDLKAYDDWCKRAEQLRINGVEDVSVSTVLLDSATEEDWRNDPDFADYLLRFRKHELRTDLYPIAA